MRQKAKLYCDSVIKDFNQQLYNSRSRSPLNSVWKQLPEFKIIQNSKILKDKQILFDNRGEILDMYKNTIKEEYIPGSIRRKFIFQ